MINNSLFSKIEAVLKDEELSINSIFKRMTDKKINVHRLYLSGYLKALWELGYMDEKSVPPARVYRFKKKSESIYEIVGKHAKKVAGENNETEIAISALNKLFKRPVFREELKKCGLSLNDIGIEGIGNGEEREELKTLLNRSGMGIPERDPCYICNECGNDSADLLSSIVTDLLKVSVIKTKTKQARLEDIR